MFCAAIEEVLLSQVLVGHVSTLSAIGFPQFWKSTSSWVAQPSAARLPDHLATDARGELAKK